MDEVKKLTIKDISRMYEEKEQMSWISNSENHMDNYDDQAISHINITATTTISLI